MRRTGADRTGILRSRGRRARKEGSWCPGEDSNLHGSLHWYLKPARLPIPPPGQGWESRDRGSREARNLPVVFRGVNKTAERDEVDEEDEEITSAGRSCRWLAHTSAAGYGARCCDAARGQGGRSNFERTGSAPGRRRQSGAPPPAVRARRAAACGRDHPQSPRRILPARAPAAGRRHRERTSRRPRLPAAGRSLRAGVPRAAADARNHARRPCRGAHQRHGSTAAGRKARSSRFSSATRARSSAGCTTSPASASSCPTIRASVTACWCRAVISAARAPARSCWSKLVEQPTRTAQPLGHVTRVLGEHAAPGMETEIAIHSHGLPFEFPREAVAEAEAFGRSVAAAAKRGREDLRELPLVTIDGEDARDFDDAVYCEAVRAAAGGSSSRSPTWRATWRQDSALDRKRSIAARRSTFRTACCRCCRRRCPTVCAR